MERACFSNAEFPRRRNGGGAFGLHWGPTNLGKFYVSFRIRGLFGEY